MYGYVPSTAPRRSAAPVPTAIVDSAIRSGVGCSLERPKSSSFAPALRQHHVARLEIAMHQPAPMRVIERIGQFGGVAQDIGRRQRPAHEPLSQRLALEILHDEKADAVVLADVVEVADVRMVERRHGPGLAFEALAPLGVVRKCRAGP